MNKLSASEEKNRKESQKEIKGKWSMWTSWWSLNLLNWIHPTARNRNNRKERTENDWVELKHFHLHDWECRSEWNFSWICCALWWIAMKRTNYVRIAEKWFVLLRSFTCAVCKFSDSLRFISVMTFAANNFIIDEIDLFFCFSLFYVTCRRSINFYSSMESYFYLHSQHHLSMNHETAFDTLPKEEEEINQQEHKVYEQSWSALAITFSWIHLSALGQWETNHPL